MIEGSPIAKAECSGPQISLLAMWGKRGVMSALNSRSVVESNYTVKNDSAEGKSIKVNLMTGLISKNDRTGP